jgi:hypothetical protein
MLSPDGPVADPRTIEAEAVRVHGSAWQRMRRGALCLSLSVAVIHFCSLQTVSFVYTQHVLPFALCGTARNGKLVAFLWEGDRMNGTVFAEGYEKLETFHISPLTLPCKPDTVSHDF